MHRPARSGAAGAPFGPDPTQLRLARVRKAQARFVCWLADESGEHVRAAGRTQTGICEYHLVAG
jgi:hypothetical protein